jgi:hypothetical protein
MEAVELRPGVSLVAVEGIHYHTGHFTPGYREFFEVVFGAAVQPSLSIRMPVPRFCIYALSLLSDSSEFVERECSVLFEPTTLMPGLRLEFSEDGASCDMIDGTSPIVSLRSAARPTYERKTLWGQYYSDTQGLRQGVWRWEGELFENMKAGSSATFHEHAFFKGVDMKRVRGVYRQMAAKPDTVSVLSRWLPGVTPS